MIFFVEIDGFFDDITAFESFGKLLIGKYFEIVIDGE
jgi:hypothetical protein